jgi:hypothetical protein
MLYPSLHNSFEPVADCIPGPNLRRILVGIHVEGEPFRLVSEEGR